MNRKGECTREYLYTALRMSAAPEINLDSEETSNTFKLYTVGRELLSTSDQASERRSSPAEKETIKHLKYSFP